VKTRAALAHHSLEAEGPGGFVASPARHPAAVATPLGQRQSVTHAAALTVAIIAAVILALMVVRAMGATRGDFEAYYSGAWAIRENTALYDRALAWRDAGFAVKYPGPEPVSGSPYVYPPMFAAALVPFSFLSLEVAGLIWLGIGLGCLLGTAYVLIGLLFPSLAAWVRVPAVLGLGGLIALYQPARSILFTGQGDALLLFLMALALAAFTHRRDARAGSWIALAIAIKPTAGFLILFLLWKRAYRAAIVATGLSAALVLAPFVVLGADVAADAYAAAQYWSSAAFGVSPVNQSPYGLLLRLLTPNAYTVPIADAPLSVFVLRILVIAGTFGLLAASVGRSRAVPPSRIALEFGMMIIGMLLAGPLSEDNHYLYLVIPFVATAAILLVRRALPGRPALAAGFAAVLAYLSLPTLNALDNAFYAYYIAPVTWPLSLLTGMHVYGLIALAILVLLVARREAREARGSSA
jgi:hypothetical protein